MVVTLSPKVRQQMLPEALYLPHRVHHRPQANLLRPCLYPPLQHCLAHLVAAHQLVAATRIVGCLGRLLDDGHRYLPRFAPVPVDEHEHGVHGVGEGRWVYPPPFKGSVQDAQGGVELLRRGVPGGSHPAIAQAGDSPHPRGGAPTGEPDGRAGLLDAGWGYRDIAEEYRVTIKYVRQVFNKIYTTLGIVRTPHRIGYVAFYKVRK